MINQISTMSNKGTIDYSNGKIYIIRNTENDKAYVGSTFGSLNKRFNGHTNEINTHRTKGYRFYKAMGELGKDCFYIELIEEYPCENVTQLRAREGHWIRHYNTWQDEHGYIKKLEARTKPEYYQDTKEHVLEKVKEYYNEHKEERDTYEKEHYEANREHYLEYKQ